MRERHPTHPTALAGSLLLAPAVSWASKPPAERPVVQLAMDTNGSYRLRQGAHDMQISTLEAAAGLLEALPPAVRLPLRMGRSGIEPLTPTVSR